MNEELKMVNIQGKLYPSVKDMCDFLTNCNYSLDDLYFRCGTIVTNSTQFYADSIVPVKLPTTYYNTVGVFKNPDDKKPLIIFCNSEQCIIILDDILVGIVEKAYEETISIREVKWDYKAAMDYDFNLFAIDKLKPYRSDTDGPSDENPFTAG